jgi:predicted nucleotide-binding protein (sugar kinase/HSP70/actin superfamily)
MSQFLDDLAKIRSVLQKALRDEAARQAQFDVLKADDLEQLSALQSRIEAIDRIIAEEKKQTASWSHKELNL